MSYSMKVREVFVNYLEEINHDKTIDGQIFKDFSKQGIQI